MRKRRTSKTGYKKRNQYGVVIPLKLYNQYIRDIKQINAYNQARYEKVAGQKLKLHGEDTDMTVRDRIDMQKLRKGSILSNKYGTMQTALQSSFEHFKDTEMFVRYAESIHQRATPQGLKAKQVMYKENYLKAFRNVFGDEKSRIRGARAKRLYKAIKDLSAEELEYITLTNENSDINYQYSFEALERKLSNLEYAILGK